MATPTKFSLKTTVDITNHIKTSKDNKLSYGQKQNYLTVINTIGLRVNPTIDMNPLKIKDKRFGNNDVWQLDFSVEFESALTVQMMVDDFMFVPFVVGLEETQEFVDPIFITKGDKTNIVFEKCDK